MPIALSTARSAPISSAAYKRFFTPSQQNEMGAPVTLTDYLLRIQEYGARQHFTRNETIFNQDDPAEQVYRIVSGTVRLCRYMPDGRRYIVDFLLPGDLMGFVESPDLPASAEAVTEVTLVAFPRVCFDRLAEEMRQCVPNCSAISRPICSPRNSICSCWAARRRESASPLSCFVSPTVRTWPAVTVSTCR